MEMPGFHHAFVIHEGAEIIGVDRANFSRRILSSMR